MLLLLSLFAQAGEPTTLTWDLSLNGSKVGERTLSVTSDETSLGELRTLQSETSVQASVLGQTVAL